MRPPPEQHEGRPATDGPRETTSYDATNVGPESNITLRPRTYTGAQSRTNVVPAEELERRREAAEERRAAEPGVELWRDARTRRLYKWDSTAGLWRWIRPTTYRVVVDPDPDGGGGAA